MADLITAADISRMYKTEAGEFYALKHVSIGIPEGKLTILRGRSGSGKTTLMNSLSALDYPTEGKVFFDGKDITDMSEKNRTKLRRNAYGYVFQSPALIPMMSAYENVEFALRLSNYKGDREARVAECLKLVGLSQRAKHLPEELSGGEQQRVAIARAIAHSPRVLFADEPTGALDTAASLSVIKVFKNLTDNEGMTIIMTTHDVGLMELGDQVYELEGGELIHESDH